MYTSKLHTINTVEQDILNIKNFTQTKSQVKKNLRQNVGKFWQN